MKLGFINIQARLLNLLPSNVKKFANSIRVLPIYVQWFVHPSGRKHTTSVLEPYHNRYDGCRCIVIGNGPSLRKMNLALLKDEYTFGLNRIYLMFKELRFETTFLVSVNRFVLQQFSDDLAKLTMLKFLNWAYRSRYNADRSTSFVCFKPRHITDGSICDGIYPLAATVTNVALEIAFFMGFSEVILIGVDHSYKDEGVGNVAIVSQKPDVNHFSQNYFGPGVTWQLPDYILMEQGYQVMKCLFENDGRRIVDATSNGNLSIFQKVDFEDYLFSSQYKNQSN
jgi:hypothetical protein